VITLIGIQLDGPGLDGLFRIMPVQI
jgi:hypothetical protein